MPPSLSTASIPVRFDLDQLEREINRAAPMSLWSIDERRTCIPPVRATICLHHVRKCKGEECRNVPCKLGVKRAQIAPPISCRIVGRVTRGRIRLGGQGGTIALTMPVNAVVSARDVGGIIRQETATGGAIVRARVRLGIRPDWTPRIKLDLAYDWTDPPGIDFLGQRIRFVSRADAALRTVMAGLERDLPRAVPSAMIRRNVEGAWREAFTVIELNRARPPAWMRVVPKGLGLAGYSVRGRSLEAVIAAQAVTESFIGERPPARPAPTSLPPPLDKVAVRGLRFQIPVLADYAELVPPLERALGKLARKGITLERLGPVQVSFGKVTIYPTEGGRLAVGIEAAADLVRGPLSATRGTVWLTGLPYNEPGSERVHVRDLRIHGRTDRAAVDLLVSLFLDARVIAEIEAALTHDFRGDYEKVLIAARKAIASRREAGFLIEADIARVQHGQVQVTGAGLYMPTEVIGQARIRRLP